MCLCTCEEEDTCEKVQLCCRVFVNVKLRSRVALERVRVRALSKVSLP